MKTGTVSKGGGGRFGQKGGGVHKGVTTDDNQRPSSAGGDLCVGRDSSSRLLLQEAVRSK